MARDSGGAVIRPTKKQLPLCGTPPPVSTLRNLRARNSIASTHLIGNGIALIAGVLLAHDARHWVLYTMGELVLMFAFVHAFVLLHEAGHRTLFRQPWLNDFAGHLAGAVALIPYASWRPIHARHHRYTGWQDLDATTATLVPRPLARWERMVINFAWRFRLPLFSILYRLQNYWHLPRIGRFLGTRARPVYQTLNAVALLGSYAVLAAWVGIADLLWLIGPALVLALMAQDVLLLSQHTHMPTHFSGGQNVRLFPPREQGSFTRSLRLPGVLSRALLHFDAHELHHLYPGVPGYLLWRIAYTPPNEVHWLIWLRATRKQSGTDFLFGRREQTGFKL